MPREVHPEQGQVEQRLGHEVAVGHRIERVLEAAVEPELGRDVVGVERQRGTGERAGAEGRGVEAVDGGEHPVDVAGERPPVRQQVVRQQHGLGPLQVGVAGEVHVGRLPRPLGEHVLERHDLLGHAHEGAPAPQPQRGGDLVVAAPTRVDLGTDVADQLGDASLDGGVHVLVTRGEHEDLRRELLFDHVERVDEGGHLAVGQDPRLAESLDVGARADEVVVRQHPVEGQADRELRHGVRHARRDATLPQRHDPPLPAPPLPACRPRRPRRGPDEPTTSRRRGPTGGRTPRRRRAGRCPTRRRWPARGRRAPPGSAGRPRRRCPARRSAGAPPP